MESLYDAALFCGITPAVFQEHSVNEILDVINACLERKRQDAKERVSLGFVVASQIAQQIAIMFSGEGEATKMWDHYPVLFSEEKKQYEIEKRQEEVENYKEKRRAYVEEYNRRRGI